MAGSSLDPVLLIPIDRAWVEEREADLIAREDEMFRAARDRAASPEERAYWDEFLATRAKHLAARGVGAK